MRYYPINLNLQGKDAVIVGGGPVAARKAARLIASGARVTVIAPCLDERLTVLASRGELRHLDRVYVPGDLAGAALVFAATGRAEVNRAVAEEGRAHGIPVDRVDEPAQGDFTTPAVLEQGGLLITVSTSGASPALAQRIVKELEKHFGPEYAEAVSLLGTLREKRLTEKGGSAYNERVFAELAALDLPALIRNGQRDAIEQILLKFSGSGSGPVTDGADKKDPS
ncbi:bifunctional precorrin-2 dehydrogenase/sirohydrochlorin ferrochelatase [Geomonas sp. Red32]|uniref:precorrin-2 dehydrogenase/sirohydrochlorin ferrochelatase family protein n=1 Tax=Geomonas sp. Red32 TaxID=2912856 RepID=UPI00202D0CAA|nr:bifunctional precorrin-2 dehydrogenase/sirohydrochlorin ferrochelatase [Geomonas sp. Red32]MCM0080298.1 bifunctional precorrin-2 dehydrogenase/sirohydrochlorin ferrochelatase [Geomonas sp. Red32]